jgi:cytosine deaminase
VSLTEVTPSVLLEVALAEARVGLGEGGIPIRTALFGVDGRLLGRGHNRRVQDDDPSMHAETTAFRAVGRQRDYRDTIMVTTCRRAGIAAGWSASSV